MSTPFAIQTAIEIVVAALLIIGILNESKLADLEQRIVNKFKRSK